jgi:hypothetical protein
MVQDRARTLEAEKIASSIGDDPAYKTAKASNIAAIEVLNDYTSLLDRKYRQSCQGHHRDDEVRTVQGQS